MSTTFDKAVPVRFKSESLTGHGPAVIEIDGHDVAHRARSITIRSAVGEVATVEIGLFAMGGLDVTLPAAVTVNMLPLEDGDMDVTTLADGTMRYRFTRKAHVNA